MVAAAALRGAGVLRGLRRGGFLHGLGCPAPPSAAWPRRRPAPCAFSAAASRFRLRLQRRRFGFCARPARIRVGSLGAARLLRRLRSQRGGLRLRLRSHRHGVRFRLRAHRHRFGFGACANRIRVGRRRPLFGLLSRLLGRGEVRFELRLRRVGCGNAWRRLLRSADPTLHPSDAHGERRERQHPDRDRNRAARSRRRCQARRRRARRTARAGHAERADRPRDVLEVLLAHVLEAQVELAGDLVVDRRRHEDAAGGRDALQARRHVHAVAEQVGTLDHDLAEVDADPEQHPLRLGQRLVARLQRLLDLDGAAHAVDDAAELGEHRVARRVGDAAVVVRDDAVDDRAMRGEHAQRTRLVLVDEAAVADRVGREDAGQAAFQPGGVHGRERGMAEGTTCTSMAAQGAQRIASRTACDVCGGSVSRVAAGRPTGLSWLGVGVGHSETGAIGVEDIVRAPARAR